jgi:hypothetical protein
LAGHTEDEVLQQLYTQPPSVSQSSATNDDYGSTIISSPKRKRCPFVHNLTESFYCIENPSEIGYSLGDEPCNGCSIYDGEAGIIPSMKMKFYK